MAVLVVGEDGGHPVGGGAVQTASGAVVAAGGAGVGVPDVVLHFGEWHPSGQQRRDDGVAGGVRHELVGVGDTGRAGEPTQQVAQFERGQWPVTDLATTHAARVVLELDEVVRNIDRNVLYRSIRATGTTDLRYEHLRAHEEPLLAIPDAIAWCWSRGGTWRARVRELVDTIRTV